MEKEYSTGAEKSPLDIRTFSYIPTTANKKGGLKYEAKDIEDQHRVGICTSISMTMNARKVRGIKYSADFQYLLQKKLIDGNWNEGSSAFSALKVAHKYGMLPDKDWKFTDEDDRKLSYQKYIKKLQAITDKEIEELLEIAILHKIEAYAKVNANREDMANAIDESEAGLITRFVIDRKWWTGLIEPLRRPDWKTTVTGHLVSSTNYSGNSFRIANSWGPKWGDKGTAYHLLNYMPTEAWIPYYGDVSKPIKVQQESREKIIGTILDYLQKIIVLVTKLK